MRGACCRSSGARPSPRARGSPASSTLRACTRRVPRRNDAFSLAHRAAPLRIRLRCGTAGDRCSGTHTPTPAQRATRRRTYSRRSSLSHEDRPLPATRSHAFPPPLRTQCSTLSANQLQCDYSCSCTLGEMTNTTCKALVPCTVCLPTLHTHKSCTHIRKTIPQGRTSFRHDFICQFCFQTPAKYHICTKNTFAPPHPPTHKNVFHFTNAQRTLCEQHMQTRVSTDVCGELHSSR